jgi:acetyltransferase-like isoleucine patch superfamily enzyme
LAGHLLGSFENQPRTKTIGGKDPATYLVTERDCWVDCRGSDMLVLDDGAHFGYEVKLITQSHDTTPGNFGHLLSRPIIVHKDAFIAAFSVLYNCEIGENAIVAAGSVVRSMKVPPFCMVAGNPAMLVKMFDKQLGKWVGLTGFAR